MLKTNDTNKGITLIALVVTIIILLILLSVSTYYGTSQIESSKLEVCKTELKIMQEQVNSLYQSNKTNDGTITISNITYNIIENADNEYQTIGKDYTEATNFETAFKGAFETESLENVDLSGYRYFDKTLLENLGIDKSSQEFLVNIAKREVISLQGFEYKNKMYYTLSQIDGQYNVEYEEPTDNTVTFDVSANLISSGLNIEVTNVKCSQYVEKYEIQYQSVNSEEWITTSNNSFKVDNICSYNIKIVDAKNNESELKTISYTNVLNENYEFTDSKGEKTTIPSGFALNLENNDISSGLVIKDDRDNEFVWIPCVQRLYLNEDDAIMTSIENYGGFYISRYEAGVEDGTLSIASGWNSSTKLATNLSWTGWSGSDIKLVSKKDAIVWNYITEAKAIDLAENLYELNDKVGSTLPTSGIWKTILNFIDKEDENSSILWGNYANSEFEIDSANAKYSTDNGKSYDLLTNNKTSSNTYLLTAGASNKNKIKNVYDFAGNLCEFTKSMSEGKYVCNGGSYLDSGTNSTINNTTKVSSNFANADLGFRIMLYIK